MPIRCTIANDAGTVIDAKVLIVLQVIRLTPIEIESTSNQFQIDRDADVFVAVHVGRHLEHPPDATGHEKPAFIFVQYGCNCMADRRQVLW